MTIIVSATYKFVRIDNTRALREQLLGMLRSREMKGTILVAPEGINGTISGTPEATQDFFHALRRDERFADLQAKHATTDAHPFQRLKVRLKREIVTLRAPEADPTKQVGAYVDPAKWNELISQPDVLVIDTRNAYEVAEGTFERAVDPGTRSFGQFPQYVAANLDPQRHRKIAMFCTGGIRCEKASAYLLAHGFGEVYHLKGGILNYLASIPEEQSLWRGKCFVFDERGGVDGDADLTGNT